MADPTQVIGPAQSGVYTPEAIARRLQIAQQLLDQSKTPPIVHPLQGLNELLKGYLGGEMYGRAENMEAQGQIAAANSIRAQAGLLPLTSTVPPYRSPIERIADLFRGKPADVPAIPPPVASVAPPSGLLPAPPPTAVNAVPRIANASLPSQGGTNVQGFDRISPSGDPIWQNADPKTAIAAALNPPPRQFAESIIGQSGQFTPLPPRPGTPVPSTAKVWGDKEAEAAGLYPAASTPATGPIPPTAAASAVTPPITPIAPSGPPVRTAETANPLGIPPAIRAQIDAATRNPNTLPQANALMSAIMKREGSWRMVTDPAERAKAGYGPTDKTPLQVNDLTGEYKLLDQRPTTNINQQGMLGGQTVYEKGKAEQALALEGSADKAAEERSRIDVFRQLNQQIKTGKLAPAQATIGAWADALGIDPEKLGISRNTAVTAQMMESLQNTMTLSMIGGTGGMPANNFSDADRKFLQSTTPGLARLQGGNDILLDMKQRALDRQLEKVEMWDQFKAKAVAAGKAPEASFGDFERAWREHVRNSPSLFSDIPAKIKSLGGAPAAAPTSTNATPAESKVLNDGWGAAVRQP